MLRINKFQAFRPRFFRHIKKSYYLCTRKTKGSKKLGALAQLVEHRTENPCVPGSIPGGTTPPFIMNPAKVFGLSGVFVSRQLSK